MRQNRTSPGQKLQLRDTPVVSCHGVVKAALFEVPQTNAPIPPRGRQQGQLSRGSVCSKREARHGNLLLKCQQQLVRPQIEHLQNCVQCNYTEAAIAPAVKLKRSWTSKKRYC